MISQCLTCYFNHCHLNRTNEKATPAERFRTQSEVGMSFGKTAEGRRLVVPSGRQRTPAKLQREDERGYEEATKRAEMESAVPVLKESSKRG